VNPLPYLRSLAGRFFERSRIEDEMEEELRAHIQARADDLEREGHPRTEAERLARLEFGGHERFKEECREELGVAFGVLNGLILRPLNVPQAENLYGTQYGSGAGWQSYPNYVDLRDRNRSFDDLAAFNFAFVGLDTGNNPASASGFATSGNYFDVLRLRPYLGRFYHSQDEHGPASAPYLVLSYKYWHSRFHDDRNVVGRVVRLNKHPFTIIGVAPPGFQGTLLFVSVDFFMPIVNQEQVGGASLNVRGSSQALFEAFGHLKPGVTPEQATADVNAVGEHLRETYPKELSSKNASLSRQGLTSFGRPLKAFVTGLMLLAGLILLAACANLGSLFTAHAADRSREVALRLALGSSRSRILRQLLTEAVLVSLAGGAAGLLGSIALLRRLSVWSPFPATPVHLPVAPDAKVYAVALVLALVSGLLFGLAPVRQVLRTDPYQVVKTGAGGGPGRRITLRDALLAVQIALCAVLVTSSMVAVRGLARSLYGRIGFEPGNAVLAGVDLAMAGYSGGSVSDMQRRMVAAMETIPGVEGAGLVTNYPPLAYGAGTRVNVFKDETRELRPSNAAAMPYRYNVSPGYFGAAHTNLLAGRDFTWHDDQGAPAVAVVNRVFADKLLGSVPDAIAKYFRLQDGTRVQVVGVAEDGKYLSLTEDPQPAMFLSFLQAPPAAAYLVVRSHRDAQELGAAMRSRLRELDRGLPVSTETWNGMLEVVRFPARMATAALGVLGIMGAMLSITGIFGMAAYSVSRRLKELGIRMALGARRKEVLGAALGRAFKLLAVGSAAGLVLGLLAGRVLAAIVYQATPRDPVVLAGVVLAMIMVGLVATWIPAQRALTADPARLLREE
jgi:predicted permease